MPFPGLNQPSRKFSVNRIIDQGLQDSMLKTSTFMKNAEAPGRYPLDGKTGGNPAPASGHRAISQAGEDIAPPHP